MTREYVLWALKRDGIQRNETQGQMEIEIYEANNSVQVVDERDTDEWHGWSGLAESIIARLQPGVHLSFIFPPNITNPMYQPSTRAIPFFSSSVLLTLVLPLFFCFPPLVFLGQLHLAEHCGSFPYYRCDVMDCVFNETTVRPVIDVEHYCKIMTLTRLVVVRLRAISNVFK